MSQIIPLFKRVAQKETAPVTTGEGRIEKFFVFNIDKQTYTVPAVDVAEVANYSSLIDIPSSSELVDGVVNVRGTVIPIINVRKRLGFDKNINVTAKTKILYFTVKQGFLVGMIVDDIEFRLRDGIIENEEIKTDNDKSFKLVIVEEKEKEYRFPVFFIDELVKPAEFDDIQKVLEAF